MTIFVFISIPISLSDVSVFKWKNKMIFFKFVAYYGALVYAICTAIAIVMFYYRSMQEIKKSKIDGPGVGGDGVELEELSAPLMPTEGSAAASIKASAAQSTTSVKNI